MEVFLGIAIIFFGFMAGNYYMEVESTAKDNVVLSKEVSELKNDKNVLIAKLNKKPSKPKVKKAAKIDGIEIAYLGD